MRYLSSTITTLLPFRTTSSLKRALHARLPAMPPLSLSSTVKLPSGASPHSASALKAHVVPSCRIRHAHRRARRVQELLLHPRVRGRAQARLPVCSYCIFLRADVLPVCRRHIDTAQMYRNEADVGKAVKASSVPREEIFVSASRLRAAFLTGLILPTSFSNTTNSNKDHPGLARLRLDAEDRRGVARKARLQCVLQPVTLHDCLLNLICLRSAASIHRPFPHPQPSLGQGEAPRDVPRAAREAR